jgi:hypothetical protein
VWLNQRAALMFARVEEIGDLTRARLRRAAWCAVACLPVQLDHGKCTTLARDAGVDRSTAPMRRRS